MTWKIQTFCLVLNLMKLINGQSQDDVNRLMDDLFTNYRKEIVPVSDHSKPIEIGIKFYLMAINSFDEVEETLSINGGLLLNWTDHSLKWNESSYGNESYLEIPSTDIWLPWIYLVNSAKTLRPIGSNSLFQATIFSNGIVVYSPGDVLGVKCATDVSKFPFDTQMCEFEFHAQHIWSLGKESCLLETTLDGILMNYYTENVNWKVVNPHAYTKHYASGLSTFQVNLYLRRIPNYHAVMTILPSLLLCFLNPVVFSLPVASGERISMAMTILLSYAIFLTLIASSIPASSNPMCFLLVIMITITAVSGLIVIFVIVSNRYYYKKSYKPGKCAICITRMFSTVKKVTANPDRVVKQMYVRSGEEFAGILDRLFMIISYVLICICVFAYFVFIM